MRILLGLALTLAAGTPAGGHHSFAAYYFEDQSVTLEGEVVEFDFRAPHAWVHVLAPDARGELQRVGAEWSNPRRLARDGITSATLKPGDHVEITGSPGRTASEHRIHLKRIRRASDGWEWRSGRFATSGRGRS